jgi:hypothetical protein
MTHFGDPLGHMVGAVAWFASGALAGTLHFLTLRWNVRMLTSGGLLLLPAALQVLRFALVGVALAAIACFAGAPALLITTFGLLAGRSVLLRFGALQ